MVGPLDVVAPCHCSGSTLPWSGSSALLLAMAGKAAAKRGSVAPAKPAAAASQEAPPSPPQQEEEPEEAAASAGEDAALSELRQEEALLAAAIDLAPDDGAAAEYATLSDEQFPEGGGDAQVMAEPFESAAAADVPVDPEVEWEELMHGLKPSYLAVPKNVRSLVDRLSRSHKGIGAEGGLGATARSSGPAKSRFLLGALEPKAAVDPGIVRAFVHRIDENFDDGIEEEEIAMVVHKHMLKMSPQDIQEMFEERLTLRPWLEQQRRALSWMEIFLAMRAKKKWTPAVDVRVVRDGAGEIQLTVELGVLESWCAELSKVYGERSPGLRRPEVASSSLVAAKAGAGSRDAAMGSDEEVAEVGAGESAPQQPVRTERKLAKLNAFFAAVVSAMADDRSGELQREAQRFLSPPVGQMQGSTAARILQATCENRRCLWSYEVGRYRDRWLQLFRAVGLNPLVYGANAAGATSGGSAAQQQVAELMRTGGLNVARSAAALSSMGRQRMQIRAPRSKVQIRSSPDTTEGAASPTAGGAGDAWASGGAQSAQGSGIGARTLPWDEKREQSEVLINECLAKGAVRRGAEAAVEQGDGQGGDGSGLGYSFEARRTFQQLEVKQQRASDEQRFLGAQRRLARAQAAGGAATAAAAPAGSSSPGAQLLGASTPPPPLRAGRQLQQRGAGASSLTAAHGVRGHFHNTTTVSGYHEEHPHRWPSAPVARLDGSHIDPGLQPPLREEPKLSGMPVDERKKHFSALFPKGASIFDEKCRVQAIIAGDREKYQEGRPYDFRPDLPQRHGKFGRRVFDPQVKDKPVPNPRGISEIETKPIQEQLLKQEQARKLLDRALPSGQKDHFQTYMPRSELPEKNAEMAGRKKVLSVFTGGPRVSLWEQHRRREEREMDLLARPLNASQLDKMVPLA